MNNQNLSPTPKVEGKGIQKLCYFGMSPFQFQKWHSPKSAAQLTRTGIVKCSKAQQNSFLFTWHKKNQSVALNGKPTVIFSHFYFADSFSWGLERGSNIMWCAKESRNMFPGKGFDEDGRKEGKKYIKQLISLHVHCSG